MTVTFALGMTMLARAVMRRTAAITQEPQDIEILIKYLDSLTFLNIILVCEKQKYPLVF